MCGRYAASRRPEDLTVEFEAADATGDRVLPADYNVAPAKEVHVVLLGRVGSERSEETGSERSDERIEMTARHGVRELRVARWGLVPGWALPTRGATPMINARIETVAERPAFRSAWRRRRCLVPADGWYEWAAGQDRPGRLPYFITPLDGSVLALAGLYEWCDGLLTCTILTTAASGQLCAVHDRMPVAVDPRRWAAWLDPAIEEPPVATILSEQRVAALELRPVAPGVGNVGNSGAGLVAPWVRPAAQTLF